MMPVKTLGAPLALRARRRLNAPAKGLFIMIFKLNVRGAILVAAAITGLVTLASPARADRCDDSAKELANQVDRLKVNFRAANVVYLTHPAAKELSVACRGDKYSIELYAKGEPVDAILAPCRGGFCQAQGSAGGDRALKYHAQVLQQAPCRAYG